MFNPGAYASRQEWNFKVFIEKARSKEYNRRFFVYVNEKKIKTLYKIFNVKRALLD